MNKTRSNTLEISSFAQKISKGLCSRVGVNQVKAHACRTTKLNVDDGCLLWGNRLILLQQGKGKVIEELHDTHNGD